MEQHVKILGILYIVIGGLGVAAALIVFGIFGGIAGLARAGGFSPGHLDDAVQQKH
jgi:hypothetical protein